MPSKEIKTIPIEPWGSKGLTVKQDERYVIDERKVKVRIVGKYNKDCDYLFKNNADSPAFIKIYKKE